MENGFSFPSFNEPVHMTRAIHDRLINTLNMTIFFLGNDIAYLSNPLFIRVINTYLLFGRCKFNLFFKELANRA